MKLAVLKIGKIGGNTSVTDPCNITVVKVVNLIRRDFNKTKVNFQCIELLFIEQFLMTRYRHIGIFGESEGDHLSVTNLEI